MGFIAPLTVGRLPGFRFLGLDFGEIGRNFLFREEPFGTERPGALKYFNFPFAQYIRHRVVSSYRSRL
jgi:hypothetical protein